MRRVIRPLPWLSPALQSPRKKLPSFRAHTLKKITVGAKPLSRLVVRTAFCAAMMLWRALVLHVVLSHVSFATMDHVRRLEGDPIPAGSSGNQTRRDLLDDCVNARVGAHSSKTSYVPDKLLSTPTAGHAQGSLRCGDRRAQQGHADDEMVL